MKRKLIAGILCLGVLISTIGSIANAASDPGDSEPVLSSRRVVKLYSDPGDSEPVLRR